MEMTNWRSSKRFVIAMMLGAMLGVAGMELVRGISSEAIAAPIPKPTALDSGAIRRGILAEAKKTNVKLDAISKQLARGITVTVKEKGTKWSIF
jgi:hypothetical protein